MTVNGFPSGAGLEGLLDSLDAAVLALDPELRVCVVNDPAENLLGRSRTRLAGRALSEVDALGARLALVAARVVEGGSAVHEEVSHAGGRLPVAATPWWSEGLECGVVLLVGAARALEVSESRTDVGVLAVGLAHEIRNPLAALRGAAELLSHDVATGRAPAPEYLDLIHKEASRMDALVGRILELGRPPRLGKAPVRIADLLHELAIEARALGQHRGVPVQVEERYDPALPEVMADRERLYEALLNLVKNAVEATPAKGGTVVLGGRVASELRRRSASGRPQPLVQVSVIDEGPGLGEQSSRLFTPFFTTKTGGTGLGLVLARHAIEAHGGILRLREGSGEPPGVEAVVLLPLGDDDG